MLRSTRSNFYRTCTVVSRPPPPARRLLDIEIAPLHAQPRGHTIWILVHLTHVLDARLSDTKRRYLT